MKRAVSLSERRERILRDEDTLRELRERYGDSVGLWLCGAILIAGTFVESIVDKL